MCRSLGFASTPSNYTYYYVLCFAKLRLIRTRFRFGSGPEDLNLAKEGDS